MTFKIDFKKLHDDWWNSLTDEERVRITEHKKLEKENTYYTTVTMLDEGEGYDYKETEQEVILHRGVYDVDDVSNEISLSFGACREYAFDNRFVDSVLERLNEDETKRFCIDGACNVYVKRNEMFRILDEAAKALNDLGIEMVEDYWE